MMTQTGHGSFQYNGPDKRPEGAVSISRSPRGSGALPGGGKYVSRQSQKEQDIVVKSSDGSIVK